MTFIDDNNAKTPAQEGVYHTTVEHFLQEDKYGEEKTHKDNVFLYVSSVAASLISLSLGAAVVWTSPVLASLRTNDKDINPLGAPITTFQESVIVSMAYFGAVLGPLILTRLCDLIGRRKSLLIISSLGVKTLVILAFAKQLYLYYITRFSLGFLMGAGVSILAIFLTEITEDHNRGKIGSLIGFSFPIGNLYVYILGPLCSIRDLTLLSALPLAVLVVALLTFIPESPTYLACKGDKQAAISSLEKLRSTSPSDIEKEFEYIVLVLKKSASKGGYRDLLSTRSIRKGLLIAVVLNIIQIMTGVVAVLAFAGPLFDAARTGISGNTTGILIGIIKLSSVFLAMNIVEKAGKKPLLLLSTFGSGVAQFFLGLFFYLKSSGVPWLNHILWMPVGAVLLYFVVYGIGLGAVAPSLTSELFPSTVKTAGVSVAAFFNFFMGALVTSVFPVFMRSLGPTWCFWVFSASSFLGFVFIYFVVPELKGKSVLEVQEILNK